MDRTRFCGPALVPALLGAGLLLVPGGARADSLAMLADGRTLEGVTLKPGSTPDKILLSGARAGNVELAPEDLLVLDFGKVAGRAPAPTARMANGDQVNGKVTFPNPKQVRIAAGWGHLTVPLAWCSALRLADRVPLPEPVGRDTLILATDRVEGEIQSIADGKVQFSLNGKPVPLELGRVQALALAPRAHATQVAEGLKLLVDLGGGERLTGRWVKLSPDLLTVRLEWGDTVDIPVTSIARLEVKNGKLVYLSDLKPSEIRQIPYLDGSFPYKGDLEVTGRPMRLGGKLYRRGLGVHSRSELTYTLDGTYRYFGATLGLDDSVAGQGSVVYRVYGDEKLLFESPTVRGGDPPTDIKLEVKGVVLLRLEVDFADNGDTADHADWAEARLLR